MTTAEDNQGLDTPHIADALDLEAAILGMDGALAGTDTEALCPVRHFFGDGVYVREWCSPAGVLVVSKIHKKRHPFFLLEGTLGVSTKDGVQTLSAPHFGMTEPGTKRVLFTHTPVRWITVHATDKTALADIEAEIIADPGTKVGQDFLAGLNLERLMEKST